MPVDYLSVTELSGSYVSREQIERICTRYYRAVNIVIIKDVFELACGTGQGLGYLFVLLLYRVMIRYWVTGSKIQSLEGRNLCGNVFLIL